MTKKYNLMCSLRPALGALLVLGTTACGDDVSATRETDDSDSGFADDDNEDDDDDGTSVGPTTPSTSGPSTTNNPTTDNPTTDSDSDTDPINPGSDDGEPPPPEVDDELCDAGDESYVKRLIPLVQGRKPESIREVELLVSMIEQLDDRNEDGRRAVALGLMQGDVYLERFKHYWYEELRVNVTGDRRNETCYQLQGNEGDDTTLAEFIRDNPVDADYPGPLFWMPDVTYSALRLDDVRPLLRADLFARLSAPFIAGNVTGPELEEMRSSHLGRTFEATMLGRNTDCIGCHRAEWATTDSLDEEADRHYPLPGFFERGVYGVFNPDGVADLEPESSYAIFRFDGFAEAQSVTIPQQGTSPGFISPFGFGASCGGIDLTPQGSVLGWDGYFMGDRAPDDTLVDLDATIRQGFDDLEQDGVNIGDDQEVSDAESGAYLMSMHIANRMWTEAMGYPLQVANGFPRNADQRDLLQELTDDFISNTFSLRNLVATVATHPYFNQSPPDECSASTPYHMPAVFEPFSKESSDPSMRGNGVGDTVHRYGARVLLDSIAQSMWWNKPDVFGTGQDQIPAENCGMNMPQVPCDDEPLDAEVLRDTGAFLSDSDSGFSGTDLVVMLRLENEFGAGNDPDMNGDCTGPLGAACAPDDWISQLIDIATATAGADMWDVAAAIKDRMLTNSSISTGAEVAALENLMGVSLSDTVADVGAGQAEQAARRLAGMLTNTPQYMLAGVPSRDQDEADDPILVVPGTSTLELCEHLASLVLANTTDGIEYGYTCSESGVTLD